MDDRLRALGRAARAEVEATLDVDAELAALDDRSAISAASPLTSRQSVERPRSAYVWIAAAAAASVALVGGIWLLGNDEDAIQTAEPDPTTSATVASTTAPTESTVAGTPATTTPTPTTTSPTGEPAISPGSIELGPDDLIARAIDGDVWWYPGALGESPGERILLIDRDDPREQPDEGEGPNFVDHVTGTFRGSLVYSDCCEPVSGNLFAITEPGAEADLWSSPTGTSERAELWGVGYEPRFEPDGTRLLASNWDVVQVVDLATGADQFLMTSDADVGGLGAAWADDAIALLGWSFDEGLLLSVRDADDLTVELQRLVLQPPADQVPTAGIVGSTAGSITVFVRDGDGSLRFIGVGTRSWTISDARFAFDVPPEATSLHHDDDGNAATWVEGELGVVQRAGEEPFTLDEGLAEIWFPEIRGEPIAPPPGQPATTLPPTTLPPTTIPETTVPVTPAEVPVVDWRDLTWEATGIEYSCVADSPCTRVIHDADGTPISYDPVTRQLTRHSIPPVGAQLPEEYGDSPWLYHAGPDDVVYLQVDPAAPAELAADLVAVALSADDAGREVARWADVVDAVGDTELVATPDGLVNVNCCGPDQVRPTPDAEVLAPWVDRSGAEVVSTAPSIRTTAGAELTIARSDTVPTGTREWTMRPPADWIGRGMPQVTPTFDGGFVAALPTGHAEGQGMTIARGWPNGDIEKIMIEDVLWVDLDPSGRVLIGDGERFVRVEPFADRTVRPGDRAEIDVEAGTVSLPDVAEISADWRMDPVAFADAVRGPLAVNEQRTITAEQQSELEWLVTVITSNFFDDSVYADRWELTLEHGDDGRFSFVSGTWANVCQPGRGHQDFRADLCV